MAIVKFGTLSLELLTPEDINYFSNKVENATLCGNCGSLLSFENEDIDLSEPLPYITCPSCSNLTILHSKFKYFSKKNDRGFKVIEFNDAGGRECSLQESSSVKPRIWLGINEVTPKLFLPDIDSSLKGWIDYPIPDCVKLFGRMELDQEQVKKLLPYLEYFSKHGHLPSNLEL